MRTVPAECGSGGYGAALNAVAPAKDRSRFWTRIRREPLLLFLLIGSLPFTVDRLSGASSGLADNPHVISVDREALLRFLQYRSKVFNEEGVSHSFEAMSAAEKKQLLDAHIREEALYREALSWGLDKQDYVVRRRLVQSIEFALQEDLAAASSPDEAAFRRFYAANPQLYALSPTISFTHVFFRRGADAEPRANAALAVIRTRADPATLGDRFIYNANYAEQSPDSVTRDFGQQFATALFAQKRTGDWTGPIGSDHGIHLVHILKIDAGGVPPFEAVRAKVAADAAEALQRERQSAALQRIVDQYRVSLTQDLQALR